MDKPESYASTDSIYSNAEREEAKA